MLLLLGGCAKPEVLVSDVTDGLTVPLQFVESIRPDITLAFPSQGTLQRGEELMRCERHGAPAHVVIWTGASLAVQGGSAHQFAECVHALSREMPR